MTGGIFTACINSTDSLISLLGPSGRPNASATQWCILVGVTNTVALEVLVGLQMTCRWDVSQHS